MTPGILRAADATRRTDSVFYTGMSVAAAIIVLVGFAPTYYLRPQYTPEALPIHLHVHGVLFSAWIVLIVVQASLVAAGRTRWHRTLGPWAVVLAAVAAAAGGRAGLMTASREAVFDVEAARAFLTIPLFSMATFSLLVGAGVLWRQRAKAHKRLMLLATISILDAPIARWPGAPGATGVTLIVASFIAAGIIYDVVSRRRVHPAYLWGGTLVVMSQVLRPTVGQADVWQSLAALLIE
jgi:hypothetical protein